MQVVNFLLLLCAFGQVPIFRLRTPGPMMDMAVHPPPSRPREATSRPPDQRHCVSPSGRYRLELRLLAAARPVRVEAEWLDLQPPHGQPGAWLRVLPHDWGPRSAVVANNGAVVLIDEWIRRPSALALSLLDLQGATVACYSAEQIVQLLGLTVPVVLAAADQGLWCSGPPELSADGLFLLQGSGGKRLKLNLHSGELTVVS